MDFVKIFIKTLFTFIILSSSSHLIAQEDPLLDFTVKMFEQHGDKTLCLEEDKDMAQHRAFLEYFMVKIRKMKSGSPQEMAHAIWTLYPCPFRPDGKVRFATNEDILGTWINPKSSMHLRFADKAKQNSAVGPLELTCEVIGYYKEKELRTAMMAGKKECPFKKETDFSQARSLPLVSQWQLIKNGRLKVTRSDIKNHIEEWDIFYVKKAFSAKGVSFKKGDLISYLRKEKSNPTFNASTLFRHLQKLPNG